MLLILQWQKLFLKKYAEVNYNDLLANNYILVLKEEIKHTNTLSISRLYDEWWVYETGWLKHIADNDYGKRKKLK